MAATTDSRGNPETPDWDPERLLDTPLGHELHALARRLLGPGPAAARAVRSALAEPVADRLEAIARTAIACRNRDGESVGLAPRRIASLAVTGAAELERATAALPAHQREVLGLRELARFSYAQIGRVMDLEVPAVALLLAGARLQLRAALRGPYPHEGAPCAERERALVILARRQDSEAMDEADGAWIFAHMGACPGCERAHAVMLEASFRYRAGVRP